MPELNQLTIKGKKVFYSLSFDIDDFIGDGIWWLQIYDENRNLIYDKPFFICWQQHALLQKEG